MGIDKQLAQALNDQAAREAAAAAFYQSLHYWARSKGHAGAAKWFKGAHRDERHDLRHILNYLTDYCDQPVAIPAVKSFFEQPNSLQDAFKSVLQLELAMSDALNKLAQEDSKVDDNITDQFVNTLILDQIDQVKKIRYLVRVTKGTNGDAAAEALADKTIGKKASRG